MEGAPPTRRTTSEKSLLAFSFVLPEVRRLSLDFLGTRRFRGASASALGARGDDAKGATDTNEELALANEVLASPAEPAADGVAEMRRIVGTWC